MTLQIELGPEEEEHLAAKARLYAMAPEDYVHKLIQNDLPLDPTAPRKLTAEDMEHLSMRLSEGSESLPVLPAEVNDRASYYEERL